MLEQHLINHEMLKSLAQVTKGNNRYGWVKFGKQFNSSIAAFVSADLHKAVCHSS